MAFISVTRLRVRSFFFLPQFMWGAIRFANQAERSAGFLDGKLVRTSGNVFWTVTAWETEAARLRPTPEHPPVTGITFPVSSIAF